MTEAEACVLNVDAVADVERCIQEEILSPAADNSQEAIQVLCHTGQDHGHAQGAEPSTFKRRGRTLSRAHAYWDGYDLNQFGREWDCETGEFADGHLPEW